MPQAAEDLAEDLIYAYLDAGDAITGVQLDVLDRLSWFQGGRSNRLNAARNAIANQIYALERRSDDYFRTQFPRVFLAGVRQGLGEGGYTLTAEDHTLLTRIADDAQRALAEAHAHTLTSAERFLRSSRSGGKGERPGIRYNLSHVEFEGITATDAREGATYADRLLRTRNLGISSVTYSDGKKYKIEDYAGMVLRSSANRAYNLGILAAGHKQEVKWYEVQDGPECGWVAHNDPELANGEIKSADECGAYPVAHPNCRRTFLPRPDLGNGKRPKSERTTAQKAERAAVVAGASALAAGSAYAVVRSQVADDLLNRITAAALAGDPYARAANAFMQPIRQFFGVVDQNARIYAMDHGFIPPTAPNFVEDLRVAGDAFLSNGIDALSPRIRYALGISSDSGALAGDKLQMVYRYIHDHDLAQQTGEQIAKVLQFEARRRGLTEIAAFKDSRLSSYATAFWNRYGARYRIDLTDFIRLKGYLGKAKSVTFNAAGALRTQIKMFQDGSIGGHLSIVPRGIFRAIVEVDENGKLVGNIRLVPNGPLKVKLEFETPRPAGWNKLGLVQGKDFVDFRTYDIDNLRWGNLAGTFKDVAHDVRQLELKRVVLDFQVFRNTPLEIATQLRIPIDEIKAAISQAGNAIIHNPGGSISGLLSITVKDAKTFLENTFKDTTGTIFGNVRFGQFNTQLRTRLHLENVHLQDIATNLRIGGYNAFEIANVMQVRWNDVVALLHNAQSRMLLFLDDLGVRSAPDIAPLWEGRLGQARTLAPDANDADLTMRSLRAFKGIDEQAGDRQILDRLANISLTDSPAVQELKLRSYTNFVRAYYLESDSIQASVGSISDYDIRQFVNEQVRRAKAAKKAASKVSKELAKAREIAAKDVKGASVRQLKPLTEKGMALPPHYKMDENLADPYHPWVEDEIHHALKNVYREFPDMGEVTVKFGMPANPKWIASYEPANHTVILNSLRWIDIDALEEHMFELAQRKWWAGDGSVRAAVEHELGHHLYFQLYEAERNQLYQRVTEYLGVEPWTREASPRIVNELSDYAAQDFAELIAEAVSFYMTHGPGRSGLADTIFYFLKYHIANPSPASFVVGSDGIVTEL